MSEFKPGTIIDVPPGIKYDFKSKQTMVLSVHPQRLIYIFGDDGEPEQRTLKQLIRGIIFCVVECSESGGLWEATSDPYQEPANGNLWTIQGKRWGVEA